MKALLLENLHPLASAILGEAGVEVECHSSALDEDELIAALAGVDLLGDAATPAAGAAPAEPGAAAAPVAAVTAPAANAATPTAPAPAATAPAAGGNALVFTVAEDSWIDVRPAKGGKPLVSRLVKAGSTETLNVTEPVKVVVGNTHGVTATLRGSAVELPGKTARINLQ